MIIQKSKQGQVADVVQTIGNLDYVDSNGLMHHDEKLSSVMVRSSSDLTSLIAYPPGTIAYTAGFAVMWQKSSTGEWIEV